MARSYQRSFAAGEITPSLYGRVDLVKYQTGLRTLKNMFISRNGGAFNRPGTPFVGEVKDSSKVTRMIPFIVTKDISYVLEFGDEYFRVIRDGEYITVPTSSITAVTQADPGAVTTLKFHGLKTGDQVVFSDVGGMTELNGNTYTVTVTSGLSFTIGVDTSDFTAYTSGGSISTPTEKPLEVEAPFPTEVLFQLDYSQEGQRQDFIALVLVSHGGMPYIVKRYGEHYWEVEEEDFEPKIAAPTSLLPQVGSTTKWAVTAVDQFTFEQSEPALATSTDTPTTSVPLTVSWTASDGALEYRVYKLKNGVYGFIGRTFGTSFVDNGIEPDDSETVPLANTPFSTGLSGFNNVPAVVGSFQQRRYYGNIGPWKDLDSVPSVLPWAPTPNGVIGSKTGSFSNFNIDRPLKDDSSLSFVLLGSQNHEIRHFVDIGRFCIFTSQGEWVCKGNSAGAITPTEIFPEQYTAYGASKLKPIVVDGSALFVQESGSKVRDFAYEYQVDGLRSNELSAFSSHLVDDFEIVSWAYQKDPHSIVWMVRDDGSVISLTYVRDQEIFGWARHEFTNGFVEDVCAIPNGNKTDVYFLIKREIDGSTVRYIERLASRNINEAKSGIFMDSSITYNGENTDSDHTMTLSGGTDWTSEEELTLTSSEDFFEAGDVGNYIHFRDANDSLVRFRIATYSSGTVVKGFSDRDVPEDLQSTATSSWTKAIKTVTGLDHLEGEKVSVLGDGFVAANPNNPAYDELTVTDGSITLDEAYGLIHVGLPIVADIETLNIDVAEGQSMISKNKNITQVSLWVETSRGIWMGAAPPDEDETPIEDLVTNMMEVKMRYDEGYDDPVALKTGVITENIPGNWNSHGRIFIRQIDPLPMAILSVSPSGYIPFGGG